MNIDLNEVSKLNVWEAVEWLENNFKQFPICKFMLFAYSDYYPNGGLVDCKAWSDDIEILKRIASIEFINNLDFLNEEHCYIINSHTGEITLLHPPGERVYGEPELPDEIKKESIEPTLAEVFKDITL